MIIICQEIIFHYHLSLNQIIIFSELSICINSAFIIKKMVDFTELKYSLTAFRTKKTYLVFLICQMILAVAIVPIALSNPKHFRTPWVIFLEVVLFFLLAFDL